MNISEISIRRPVLATVMTVIILLFGLIGYNYLGVREYPSVDNPIISVSCSYPGANADVIENQITEPLEQNINGIPGIRSLSSVSSQGSSRITVEFELSVDLETAANDVRDKVSRAQRYLPRDCDPPTVSKADADASPILMVAIRSDKRSLLELSEIADLTVKEQLQTISDVSSVSIWGEKRYSMRLWLDPVKMAGFGLTPVVLRKFSNIVPVALIYILIPLAFPEHSETPVLLRKICLLYVIFVVVMFVNMLLKVFFGILEQKETLHDRPLKGLLQILQVGLFFLAAIVVTSLLIGRSPLKLLAGLGASAAILMLIFKDTIMGFVAGVMLSANKMLRPGDWISMPKYNVDGTVLEVTLNTVKIQNFDNTVTTVPPFILTGDSFQNWRWMQESGGRRIMRSINIDLGSVRFCTPEMTEKYKDIELLHDYVVQRETEFDRYRNGAENPNGADFFRLTNLTVFRAYLNLYLKKLAVVNHELTCMVRHLQPTPNGIPVEVYCFSVIKEWVAYESVQADLFDHIIAVVPEFDLVLFQNPSGNDIQRIFRPARNVAAGA